MKYIISLLLAYILISCQMKSDENKKFTSTYTEKVLIVNDTLINSIIPAYKGKKITGKKKKLLINKYYTALNREFERPEMADSYFSDIESLFGIFEYKNINISGKKIKSYIVNINFEDATYSSILLLQNEDVYPYNCLLIYENLKSETEYKCFSEIKSGIIIINRIGDNKKNVDTYTIKDNNFVDYYKTEPKLKQWGNKEIIYTKDGLDSSYLFQYQIKGKIKNHLKQGEWEEKKYILKYDKSVLINGKYLNGIKDGKWYYSPEGPVDKIELYEMGKIVKIYSP